MQLETMENTVLASRSRRFGLDRSKMSATKKATRKQKTHACNAVSPAASELLSPVQSASFGAISHSIYRRVTFRPHHRRGLFSRRIIPSWSRDSRRCNVRRSPARISLLLSRTRYVRSFPSLRSSKSPRPSKSASARLVSSVRESETRATRSRVFARLD